MDGVLELAPFPYSVEVESSGGGGGTGLGGKEEKAQGMMKVHQLPVGTEKGMGVGGVGGGEDSTFSLSRRRFVIRPFWLPPVEGEGDGLGGEGGGEGGDGDGKGKSGGGGGGAMPNKGDIEF